MPLLKYVRGEALSQDHWLELFRLLKMPKGTTLEKLTFGDVLEVADLIVANADALKVYFFILFCLFMCLFVYFFVCLIFLFVCFPFCLFFCVIRILSINYLFIPYWLSFSRLLGNVFIIFIIKTNEKRIQDSV